MSTDLNVNVIICELMALNMSLQWNSANKYPKGDRVPHLITKLLSS